MTRLFWKFFAGLLLAQLTTSLVVATTIWLRDAPDWQTMTPPRGNPPSYMGSVQHPMSLPGPPLQPPVHQGPHFPVLPLVVGLFTSLIFSYVLARYVAKPIDALEQGFNEIGAGRFNFKAAPLLPGRRDELADLVKAFDRTAQHLESLVWSQKRLLQDVSHEVRSPLARMQLAIDLLEQQPARQNELLQRISRESGRIHQLMEEVLTLARLESVETASTWPMNEQVNLTDLIRDVVIDVAFEAEQKASELEIQLPQACTEQPANCCLVSGNAELLHRTIENILRNAIAYTVPATSVAITLKTVSRMWCIDVTDHGPGVPPERLVHIFSPFERGGQSSVQPGFGLGLAIAAQTVKMHGGALVAENIRHADGSTGLRILLTLPMA